VTVARNHLVEKPKAFRDRLRQRFVSGGHQQQSAASGLLFFQEIHQIAAKRQMMDLWLNPDGQLPF
jgi:hypothetical protein